MTTDRRGRDDSAAELASAGWRKSRRSGSSGSCVEVVAVHGTVGVRDSKDPHGPALAFASRAWAVFVDDIRQATVRGDT